jgi:hypothetical protein
LLVFVNVAFFGMIWHTASMVLPAGAAGATGSAGVVGGGSGGPISGDSVVVRERSGWMIAGMLGCLFVVVALGVHLPSDLANLLASARHLLETPRS